MNHHHRPYFIFITGIAGFIGFHLASFLRKRGDYVIGCDNFNDYYLPKLKRARATQLKQWGIEVIDCDIQDETLKKVFRETTLTHVVHLAAQAGVRHSITHPLSYTPNLNGFLHVLELCRHHQPLKLIFASSSSVYGGNSKIPFCESDLTEKPISLYAATKKSGELMAHTYHHLYQFPIVGLRYFTVYGPWGRPDMAYYSFTKAILSNQPIALFNHGNMKRDFTYIDDIVRGTAAALEYEGGFELFNLGNHCPEELMKMLSLLEQYTGKKARIEMKPMQIGDLKESYADITKAQKTLSFHPLVSLENGLKHFVEWFYSFHPNL